MSDPTTPSSIVQVDTRDTPPTSPCDNKPIMPSPPAPVLRTANPAKLKKKLASAFASLYDDEPSAPAPNLKAKTQEKTLLAAPLWKNQTVELTPGDDLKATKNEEVVAGLETNCVGDTNGDLTKELTPPPEKIATSELSENGVKEVLPAVSPEPAPTQATQPASIDLDIAPPVITFPAEEISSSANSGIVPNVEVDNSSKITNATEGLQVTDTSSVATENTKIFKIRHEWTGTCQFDGITEISIRLQENNELDNLILYRRAIVHDITLAPHDPYFYIDLSKLDGKLSFSENSSQYAYRALLLVKAGLQTITPQQSELSRLVFTAASTRLCTSSVAIIIDDLKSMYVSAYRWLTQGLLHCGAFWDGLTVVKLGLQEFPDDAELLDLRIYLLKSFEDRHHEAMEDAKNGKVIDVTAATRPGLIYQKRYPWMAPKLFVRTPRLVREVNSHFPSLNAEVRPVVFGPPGTPSTFKKLSGLPKTADVGPLGIFAKRDIEEGESILTDMSIASVSDLPPSTGLFCDACNAFMPLFIYPEQAHRPSCGCKVTFCSKGCHDIAVGSYHKIQCGIDFGWLYNHGVLQTDWNPIMFLRVICIVLSTPGWSKDSVPQKNPLQHPLVARMTANYASNDKQASHTYEWSYQDNIITPTRILLDLGIDIFSPIKKVHEGKTKFLANIWTPELVQTMFWRMSNNANTTPIDIAGLQRSSPLPSMAESPSTGGLSRFGLAKKVHLVVLSPSYLFFNHSCRHNVQWSGTVPDGSHDLSELYAGDRPGEGIKKPGSSTVICRANRNIKAGEELTISYIGDPMGNYTEEEFFENPKLAKGKSKDGSMSYARWAIRTGLNKWFNDGTGCGCEQCAEENDRGEMPKRIEL